MSARILSLLPDSVEHEGDEVRLEKRFLAPTAREAVVGIRVLLGELRPDAVVALGSTTCGSITLWGQADESALAHRATGNAAGRVASVKSTARDSRSRVSSTAPVAGLLESLATSGVDVIAGTGADDPLDNAVYYAVLTTVQDHARAWGTDAVPAILVGLPTGTGEPDTDGLRGVRDLIATLTSSVEERTRWDRPDFVRRGGATAQLLRPMVLPTSRAPRIGVSGGVGAGKSTVTAAFRRHGAIIADADELARQVVEPGTEGLARVVEEFGPGVLHADGSLNRAALARIVFAQARARARLESITHPLIARAARDIMRAAPSNSLAIYDVPLLVETGMEELFDAVLVVDASRSLRLTRLEDRGMPSDEADRRMTAQADMTERRRVATIWIDNAGTRDDLAILVDAIIARWFLRED